MIFFLSCSTVEIKEKDEFSNTDLSLDEKIDSLVSEFIDTPEILVSKIIDLLDEDNFTYNNLLARLYISLGRYNEAKDMVVSIPNLNSNIEDLKLYIIIQQFLKEDYRHSLETLIRLDPSNIFAINTKSYDLIRNNRVDEAKTFLERAYKIDPQNSQTLILLGDVTLLEVENLGLSTKRVLSGVEERKVNNLYKKSLEYYLRVKDSQDPTYYVRLSNIYKKLGDKLNSIKSLSRAIDLDPLDVWNYYDRGKLYFYASSNKKALEDFNMAYKIDPNHFFTNVFLGRIHFIEGNLEVSLKYYNNVIKINPEYTPAYRDLSVLSYIHGDKQSGLNYIISLYNSKTDKDPLLPLYLVTSLFEVGRDDDAKKILVNLVKYEKKGTMKELYSYFLDPTHVGDSVLTDALNIKDHYQRIRLTYYVALALEREGVISLYKTLLKEVAEANLSFESKLAEYRLGENNE
ncbi:tetratricopeptide repeat protein [Thiospirochaeta perfilievii]|nr:hypothetical protein [Thiospirochaeta perfilievii]